ncbi:MAG: hypothetical protein QOH14_4129 [Pseudonocardiales bacterium]|jgi:hypothetical protein|nr:hypothetical protein [Pseudonocardiales bacterium]
MLRDGIRGVRVFGVCHGSRFQSCRRILLTADMVSRRKILASPGHSRSCYGN